MPQLAEKRVVQMGERLEGMAQSASRITSSVSDTVADNMYRVRRAAKRGWYGAHDLIDDAAYVVKRHPFKAITITAGAGFAIGFLVGCVVKRD